MDHCEYACQTADHALSRRSFLGAAATGVAGVLGGGVSQLETWDPKPNTDTGGPFRGIPTSVPGVHVSELLPHTAKQMHRMALVRGVNTHEDEHGRGATIMLTGRRTEPGFEYPHLGAGAAKLLGTGKE